MNSVTLKKISITINPDILKIIALIAMLIDHFSKYFPMNSFSVVEHYIGRISFPIFSFLLMFHLSQKQIYKKYLFRLLFFGFLTVVLLSFFLNDFNFNPIFPLNILFSFFVAVGAITGFDWIKQKNTTKLIKTAFIIFNFCFFGFLSMFCQYDIRGFCFLLALYYYFKQNNNYITLLLLIFSIFINLLYFQWIVSLLTMYFLLHVKLDKTTRRFIKPWWLFYIIYPLHLFIFGLVKFWIEK